MLITYAYDVQGYQVSGGPAWIESERYEIFAKPDPGEAELASAAERTALLRARVRAMLADRFQLKLHQTSKELPIFALVVGKNGPKGLLEAKSGESDLIDNGHHLSARKTSMDSLAKVLLQGELGRSVVNQTGVAGEFDISLDSTPDEGQRRVPGEEPGTQASTAGEGPSLFTALQEQLGLKLEPKKGPVEVLAIDHAERASEN